jgi:hypothetical protein
MKKILIILTISLCTVLQCLDAKPRQQSRGVNKPTQNRTITSFSQNRKIPTLSYTKKKAQPPKKNQYKISQTKPKNNSFSNYNKKSFKPNRHQFKPDVEKRPNLHPEPPYRPRPQPPHHHSHGGIAPIIVSSTISALSYLSSSVFNDTSYTDLTVSEEAQIFQQRLQNNLIQSASRLNINETFSISVEVLRYEQTSYNNRYAQVEVVIYRQNSGLRTNISTEASETSIDNLVYALTEKIVQATY